jgi:DNA-binding SARP family transcriptional activator/TolB-like protein
MTLRIALLGPLVIEVDGQDSPRLPKKARALVAYLAAQKGAVVPRERAADLLWPDQDAQLGRHSLRNCLLELRRALGPAAREHLFADATNCRLAVNGVDLDRFDRLAGAAERVDLRAAADLYRGEFLADLAVNSQPFQDWLEVERQRLLAQACEVLERLVRAEAAAGAHLAAIRVARRLVALDPLSEPAQRTLMQAYFKAGRRPEALRQYRAFVDLLRGELAVPPDPETRALAHAIARAARSAITETSKGWTGHGAPAAPATTAPAAREPETLSSPRWPCVVTGVSLAIAPLHNLTGDPGQKYLAEGFLEDLVTDLVRHRRGMSLARLSDARAIPSCAEQPEFDYIVTGSVQLGAARTLRINIQIATNGEYRWARRFECAPDALPSVQTAMTARISRELHLALLAQISRDAAAREGGLPELSGCLSRAASALAGRVTPETTAAAQHWYLGALAQDAASIEALVGVARTCQHIVSAPWWADPETAAIAAEIGGEAVAAALMVAPENARANSVQGMLCSASGRLKEAARAFERALAADPGLAIAQGFAGYNLAFLGHAEATEPAIRRAMRLDRTDRRDSIWLFFAGFAELLRGHTNDAIRLLGDSLERNPRYGSAQLFLAAALAAAGRRGEAAGVAGAFRRQYPLYRLDTFEQQWLSRSTVPVYRSQMFPVFERIRTLGIAG